MELKKLPPSNETLQEQRLRELAAKGTVETYRELPVNAREQLLAFLKKTGIVAWRVALLEMLLNTKQPDMLTLKKLEEVIDSVRAHVISVTMEEEQQKKKTEKTAKPAEAVPNPHRLLSQKELASRLRKLGIDLQQLIMDWESFYESRSFGNVVQKNMGQLEYFLVMPAVTHQAMEAFEKAHREGRINNFMIDDARIGDGTTLRCFEAKTLKRFRKEYGYASVSKAEAFINRTTVTPPIVRLVGYSTKRNIFDPGLAGETFADQVPRGPYESTMGLGTYLRLYHYLAAEKPHLIHTLKTYLLRGHNVLKDRTILLNNKTDQNRVLTMGPDPNDPRGQHSIEVGPAILEPGSPLEKPVPIMVSDNLEHVYNPNDCRHLAHMDTWPAPPETEEDEDIPF